MLVDHPTTTLEELFLRIVHESDLHPGRRKVAHDMAGPALRTPGQLGRNAGKPGEVVDPMPGRLARLSSVGSTTRPTRPDCDLHRTTARSTSSHLRRSRQCHRQTSS